MVYISQHILVKKKTTINNTPSPPQSLNIVKIETLECFIKKN